MDNIYNRSHKRYNPLTGEWVLVSPQRNNRPWQGKEDIIIPTDKASYDKNCYLCPGNERSNGEINPDYTSTYVFNNDFPALEKSIKHESLSNELLKSETETGICKVICFSPDHSKTLSDLSIDEIKTIVTTWQTEYVNLSKTENINHIQIFENKGSIMGCSNPHPHGQIWAQSSIPNEIIKKDKFQKEYFKKHRKTLLSDYIKQELKLKERIVFENESFVTLVPYWAIWPFEAMIIPKNNQKHIGLMKDQEKEDFAEAIKKLSQSYDKIFNCSFPYSSGIHQAPCNDEDQEHWHWHMSFYPPLLRSASIKKFMVGYEMFAMPQRDITAEIAAEVLRENLK